jgi:RNA polymerase sigma-70 factor (ECF subfamily)
MDESVEWTAVPEDAAKSRCSAPGRAEQERIRHVAHRLGRGREECEDLAQDLWVELLHRPARRSDGLIAWLQLLARHALGRLRRRERDRRHRERCAALPEALASTLDDLERDETRERIVALVEGLDEPYRSVLRMRFFDGLPVAGIAERTGRSPATVRSQIKRGLDRLRERRASLLP